VSATGYVRVATESSRLAYLGANRAALISTVAEAAAVASPASLAVRLVTGPLGWAALGVSVGLALYQMYYSPTELAQIKSVAPGTSTLQEANGTVLPAYGGTLDPGSCTVPCAVGQGQSFHVANGQNSASCLSLYTQGDAPPIAGWTAAKEWQNWQGAGYACYWVYIITYTGANGDQLARPVSSPPTPQQIHDYVASLPASDPNSIESNTTPLGVGATPTSADNTTSTAVSPTDIPTTVKPVGQVAPTDAVVDPNAAKPAGTQTVPATQSTTTTTTTTTNPDGSKTDATQESASVSCTGPEHDARSFGSILQSHITTWKGSGLLSALMLLQTLTWPDALPTITFTSATWGTHQVDFNQWASVFTVLRTLTIAGAGFAAYRIIFVGGS
jgi:hypothetical protein